MGCSASPPCHQPSAGGSDWVLLPFDLDFPQSSPVRPEFVPDRKAVLDKTLAAVQTEKEGVGIRSQLGNVATAATVTLLLLLPGSNASLTSSLEGYSSEMLLHFCVGSQRRNGRVAKTNGKCWSSAHFFQSAASPSLLHPHLSVLQPVGSPHLHWFCDVEASQPGCVQLPCSSLAYTSTCIVR